MNLLADIINTGLDTIVDVFPIVAVLFGFQVIVIGKPPPNLKGIVVGFLYVLVGLTLFLVGLNEALFPLGKTMARQLTAPDFIGGNPNVVHWRDYAWVYVFAGAIGFATTIAEPALIAVAAKAETVSGGTVRSRGLRIAVAIGVGTGVAIGAFRIVTGTPLQYYIIVGYLFVIVQTIRAPRAIIPLAYDSGGVATSTVTVPVIAALGLGLASAIPGRSPLIDGFGLIAFACVFPIMSVLGYAMLTSWLEARKNPPKDTEDEENPP